MSKLLRNIILALSCLLGSTPALPQSSETFSAYITGLAPASSVIGTERMFALQAGSPKTMTPYQILSNVIGDCTFASPPTIVCTKINGLTLAASATTDTTNATNISSGTLSLSRLALTNTRIYVGNVSNVPVGVVLSRDCTIDNLGAITCTKTNNVAFAASATTDTTNATNISAGTLAAARMAQVALNASGNGGVGGTLPYASLPAGSLDQVLGFFGSTTANAIGVPNCAGALQYSTTTHLFSCGVGGGNVTISGSPVSGQIATWVSGTAIQGVAITTLATVNKVKTQSFSSSGTYTPSAGLQFSIMECVGGGGAGGGSGGATGYLFNGGGGGGGGYSRAIASAATIGANQTVSIGNGGTAANGATGGNGGATSVGALCAANGGTGGAVGNTTTVGNGGAGGAGTTGNVMTASGSGGGAGIWVCSTGGSCTNAANFIVQGPPGQGGNSIFGGGGVNGSGADPSVTQGVAGGSYGGGGSGSQNNNLSTTFSLSNGTGGAGSNGVVIITEFTNQ